MKSPRYTAVVIDDEEKLRKLLQMKLDNLCPHIEVVGEAGDAQSGVELIRALKPSLVFLDIAMPRGSGFDLLKSLGEEAKGIEVIFVTGYNEHALQALRVSAVDYLLKPVMDDELEAAVQKAISRLSDKEKLASYEVLQHNVDAADDQSAMLSIPGEQQYELREISTISRCEGEQRYTRVYLADGETILSSYNIGVFMDMLKPYGFYACHKSHLVNTSHIIRYHREGVVELNDGAKVPLARRRREEFKNTVLMLHRHIEASGE